MPLLKRSVKLRSSSRAEALPHMDLYQTSAVAEYEGLPALDNDADQLLMTGHGLPPVNTLFALFCLPLELDRLGPALELRRPGRSARRRANRSLTCRRKVRQSATTLRCY
jgi:hypothetical protein